VARLRGFLLLLRYSGLRCTDAAKLSTSQIDAEGRITLVTQKTGTRLSLVLPLDVAAIKAAPRCETHFFITPDTPNEAAYHYWYRRVVEACELARITGGRPHRFRDTFAVEFLKKGKTLHMLSKALGHHSISTTEKHYAPWVAELQAKLEADLRDTWQTDVAGVAA